MEIESNVILCMQLTFASMFLPSVLMIPSLTPFMQASKVSQIPLLHFAAHRSLADLTVKLIEMGADPNMKDEVDDNLQYVYCMYHRIVHLCLMTTTTI